MKLIQHALCIAALSTVAAFNSGAAHAISFRVTTGVASPTGAINQGAYSEFAKQKQTTTINFNSGAAPTTGFAQYSFTNNSALSSIRSDVWAPAGPEGEINEGKYLAVFRGNAVTVKLAKTLNYFGINWGAISPGNTFSFFKGDSLVKSFTTLDVNPVAPIRAIQHKGEGNGYLHFYSDSEQDNFDKIVISQTAATGFESDNHSFHIGTGKFDFDRELNQSVPEPSIVLGLMAAGGSMLLRRKQKSVEE